MPSLPMLLHSILLLPLALAARLPRLGSVIEAKHSSADQDLIQDIPGYHGNWKSDHYAGYVTVGKKQARHLFYYLVKAQHDAAKAPVVLWLNGGPGCSSFDGFVYELGPFKFDLLPKKDSFGRPTVRLVDNPHSWDKHANMIFLDSPVGVGLSYSDSPGDYVTGDMQTAHDANQFLRGFFARFPDLQANRFFIAGESYAGIYVPNLAREVVEGNAHGQQPHINIEGYLVGNGCTDDQVDGDALPRFAAGKSLISNGEYAALEAACSGSYWDRAPGTPCDELFNKLVQQVSMLNIYDILEECYQGSEPDAAASRLALVKQAVQKHGLVWPMVGSTPKAGAPLLNWAHLGLTPPCTDSRQVATWLNDPDVREALHAETIEKIGRFTLCSDKISYTPDHNGSMLPTHHSLVEKHGLRALIYSGDHDMAVPHTGSEAWTAGMGYSVSKPWQPWFYTDTEGSAQVAGYTVEYAEGLSYATVKGAGHMVPETNPVPSLALFERFIFGKPLYPAEK